MTTLRLVTLVSGIALTLLSMDYAFAESEKATEPEKATGPQIESVIVIPPTSVESEEEGAKEHPGKSGADAFFNRIDADKDGKISHDEYMKPITTSHEQLFQDLDSNHDGFVTPEEFRALKRVH